MSLRLSLIVLTLIAVASGTGFAIVITNVDPEQAGVLGLTMFFVTLFFGLTSLVALLGFGIRAAVVRRVAPVRHLGIAMRQAVLLSVLFSLGLMLQGRHYLRWWNALVLVLLVGTIEFFFLISTPPPYRR